MQLISIFFDSGNVNFLWQRKKLGAMTFEPTALFANTFKLLKNCPSVFKAIISFVMCLYSSNYGNLDSFLLGGNKGSARNITLDC